MKTSYYATNRKYTNEDINTSNWWNEEEKWVKHVIWTGPVSQGPVLSPKDQSSLPRTSPLSQGPACLGSQGFKVQYTITLCEKTAGPQCRGVAFFPALSVYRSDSPSFFVSSLERQTSGHAGEAEHNAGQPHMLLKSRLVYASLPKSAWSSGNTAAALS